MPFSTVTFYGPKGQTTAVIPPAGDLSDCDYSDSEDEEYLPVSNNTSRRATDSSSDDDDENNQQQLTSRPSTSKAIGNKNGRRSKKSSKNNYEWLDGDHACKIKNHFDVPYTMPDELSAPIDYFYKLFGKNLIDQIVLQTNLYSVQCTGTSINTDREEMKTFLAILLRMGVMKLSAYRDYWDEDCRINVVADLMPVKRFEKLRRYVHFCDNTNIRKEDRYAKVRPLMDAVRNNLIKIEPERDYSIDEAMIPYKGKKAGNLRQYIKNKPKKWGFKFFTRAGVSGIIYDFLPYAGSATFLDMTLDENEEALGKSGQFVTVLCRSIPAGLNSEIFVDNFFCSLELIIYLNAKGFDTLGTIRADRLRECPLKSEKELKKTGRGTFDCKTEKSTKIALVRWVDNKVVTLASSFMGVEPLGSVKRYDKKEKCKIDVTTPAIVKHYNRHMGGVDLADMLISLYRTPLRTKRYYLRIFAYMIDLCVCNSWLLARRDAKLLGGTYKLSLKKFRLQIATSLILVKRAPKRKNLSVECVPISAKKTKFLTKRPQDDVRYDATAHWPVYCKKGRCKNCKSGFARMQCSKCKVILCFTKERNCFIDFHSKYRCTTIDN